MRVGELIDMLGQANRDDLVVISCNGMKFVPTRVSPAAVLRAQGAPILIGEGEAKGQGLKLNAVRLSTEFLTVSHTMK